MNAFVIDCAEKDAEIIGVLNLNTISLILNDSLGEPR